MIVRKAFPKQDEAYEFPRFVTLTVNGKDVQTETTRERYTVAQLQQIVNDTQAKLDAITAFEATLK